MVPKDRVLETAVHKVPKLKFLLILIPVGGFEAVPDVQPVGEGGSFKPLLVLPGSWPGCPCSAFLLHWVRRAGLDPQGLPVLCHSCTSCPCVCALPWPCFLRMCPAMLPPAPDLSPALMPCGTLKYRLCGVFVCQRAVQIAANSWAHPMSLTQVNQNHILGCSRGQIRSLCCCVWPQMELPQQLRKQLFPGPGVSWSLYLCNTVPLPVNAAVLLSCKQTRTS